MFKLFAGMPLPERHQTRLGAGKPVRPGHEVFGHDGGEVLGRCGHADMGGGRHAVESLEPLQGSGRQRVDQALLGQVGVEQLVQAAVRRLLADEGFDVFSQGCRRLWQSLNPQSNRVDEKLLADRKAHRQRVEERRAEGVAAQPMARQRRLQIDQQAANHQLGHGSKASLPGHAEEATGVMTIVASGPVNPRSLLGAAYRLDRPYGDDGDLAHRAASLDASADAALAMRHQHAGVAVFCGHGLTARLGVAHQGFG